jgi:hypothetical protein
VRGEAQSPLGYGVHGHNTATSGDGYGVYGLSASPAGIGVFGRSDGGRGVVGRTRDGVGVNAVADDGIALRTSGRLQLNRAAGRVDLPAGSNAVSVTPDIALSDSSMVIATINGDPGNGVTVYRVSIDGDSFTIHLTGNAASAASIAWLVLG